MIALISDIHASMAALEAVLKDIESVGGVSRIFCLGDVIGYGPQPVECFELTAQVCSRILMGNHEHAVIYGAFGFTPIARQAIDWTRDTVQGYAKTRDGKDLWDLLKRLPVKHEFDDVLLVHGSPRDPVMEYVLESDLWEGSSDPNKIVEIFEGFDRMCFVGHTHRPGVFTEDHCFLPASELVDGFDCSEGKYLVNVGSVGQPRDRDPRSCYTLFSGDAVYFRRVEYDIEKTSSLILENPHLGDRLATRLHKGE